MHSQAVKLDEAFYDEEVELSIPVDRSALRRKNLKLEVDNYSQNGRLKVLPLEHFEVNTVGKQRIISSKEEREKLVLRYRNDTKKLALSMLKKWRVRLESEDLGSLVDLALCEAAASYDSSIGTRFMTFVYYHLKGRLIRHIAAHTKYGLLFVNHNTGSNNSSNQSEDLEISCLECPPSSSCGCKQTPAEEKVYRSHMVKLCYDLCLKLGDLEREVITRMYFDNQQLKDISKLLGYSRSYISRVHTKAIDKIRLGMQAYRTV